MFSIDLDPHPTHNSGDLFKKRGKKTLPQEKRTLKKLYPDVKGKNSLIPKTSHD